MVLLEIDSSKKLKKKLVTSLTLIHIAIPYVHTVYTNGTILHRRGMEEVRKPKGFENRKN